MRFKVLLLLTLTTVLAASILPAQLGKRGREPFEKSVFSPELLMANQRKIGLTPQQRDAFIAEMRKTQSDLLPAQLDMSEASADLVLLLEGARIDEQAALAAAGRVLELEQTIKTRHMTLLIRIKNLLTEEQQRLLREIRDAE